MIRIFSVLAFLSIVLLIAAMMLGLTMGDLYEKPVPPQQTMHWATIHRLTGVAAALAVVFVESVVVTYFIGTSRWCKEVVETYRFNNTPILASNKLKRRTFPWALAGMLAVVGIISLGGAADPATMRPNTKAWADWHLYGAFLGIAFVAWTYFIEWHNIIANHEIIEDLVAEVGRVRREQGLDDSDNEQNARLPHADVAAHAGNNR
jgi:drug/metabolite transporter (DMT)-like permease